MKKQKWGVLVLAATLGLSGCGGYVELNDKQNAEAAEYIGGLLLKYSSNYENSLIYPEETIEKENIQNEAEAEVETETETGKETSQNLNVSLEVDTGLEGDSTTFSELYGIPELQIKVNGITECKEYTQKNNDTYAIYANKGKKLLIVKLQLKNSSSNSKKIKLSAKGITYQLITADGMTYNAHRTILFDDLNFYNEKIEAGKKKQGVLVFEVPEKTKIASSQLKAEGTKGTVTEPIK